MQIVVDTSVIGRAGHEEHDLKALRTILEKKHILAMDDEGYILAEYRRHINFNDVTGEWFKAVLQRMTWLSGSLDSRQLADLEAAGGDSDDYPFIGVAMRTDSGLLLHYDRGYDRRVEVRRILAELGVRPYRAKEALAEAVL